MVSSFSFLDYEETVDEGGSDFSTNRLVVRETVYGPHKIDRNIQAAHRSFFPTIVMHYLKL